MSTTFVVDKNPSDGQSCIGTDNPYAKVTDALTAATNDWSGSHIIKICPGTYNENNIRIDSYALTGAVIESTTNNKADVIIEDSSNNPIFNISAYISNLTIQNLTFKQTKNNKVAIDINSGGSGYDFKNLDIESSGDGIDQSRGNFQNATFENLTINSRNNAINLASPANLTLYDLNITSTNGNALYFSNPTGSIILDTQNFAFNTINSDDTAINFGDSSQNYTVNNTRIVTSKNNAAAITAGVMNTLSINNVDLNGSNRGSGIWVDGTVNSVDINGSNIHDMRNEDIYFKNLQSNGSKITNNTISGGSSGIYIKKFSNAVTIQRNIVKNTTYYGLYLLDSNQWRNSQIDHNCFISNANSAFSKDTSANFDDKTEGNYWSDWSGSGTYTIQSIPRYDNHPLNSCPFTAPPTPVMQECFTDNFNRTSLGDKWSIISTGAHPPDITDNKLMLTKNIGNISSGVSLVGNFPANNNLVQIEFEGNAYAGSGADGVSVILSDANTTPVAGGFGGSLGYAPKNGILGFAGAWLGFGLDEYGNFANDSDGNKGRGCSYRPTSPILDSLTIRGRGANDRLNGYCFIANSGNLATSTGVGIDNTSSSSPAPKSNYKFIIDTRNNETLITVYRDIHDGSGYVLLPNMNEVNATQTATSPINFRLSLTGSTGGSTNYHSIDDLNISALSCGTLGQIQNNQNNYFDAWEIGAAYNISNRIIKTKIVKNNFSLNVFSLNEANTDYQDFNGTLCASIVDSNTHKVLSGWVKLLFDAANPYVNNATFNSDYASKDARINLFWKKDVDTACPINNEDNSTVSTDNFAIRPLKFTIDTNTTSLYAGVPFILDINATANNGDNSLDYNETNGTSFDISKIDSNASCPSGDLGNLPNPVKFSDGAISLNTKYSEVGDVNITVKENLGSEFALIDQKDTGATDRLIPTLSKVITFNPYRFTIIDYNFTRSPDLDWRYMADVKDANISLSFKVQAQNADGIATKKFDHQCYSKNVNVDIDLNSTNNDGNISYSQLINNTFVTGHDKNLSSFDFNGTINDQNFTEGNSSLVRYALNVYRQYNTPKNPLTINAIDINTSYPADANVINPGKVLDNNNSQFYYGRVNTNDIDTNKQSALFDLTIEVYSNMPDFYVNGFHQNSTNWYQMQKDSSTIMTALLPKVNFTLNQDKIGIDNITTTQSTLLGVDRFTITNHWANSDSAYIHIKSPSYLWYNHYKDYNDSNTSDCSTHPCFRYNFFLNGGVSGLIQSGDFNGTSIGNDYNQSTYIKSGVKVFR